MVLSVNWEEWWTYDGISGPQFWGVINPEWRLCNEGRRQSPVDLDPSRILYDPGLPDLDVREEPPIGGSKVINFLFVPILRTNIVLIDHFYQFPPPTIRHN